jgi:hypothetical protein
VRIEHGSGVEWRTIGPYSRRLQRGPISGIDGRSAEGRYIRALQAELLAVVPGTPTVHERILVDRCIRLRLQLDAFEDKMSASLAGHGHWTEGDMRAYSAIGNQFRLTIRELRARPVPGAPRTRKSVARQFVETAAL